MSPRVNVGRGAVVAPQRPLNLDRDAFKAETLDEALVWLEQQRVRRLGRGWREAIEPPG
jgi:hypothetical protein